MTEQISELVEQRRQELVDLQAERLKAQNEAQEDQDALALLDELERLERQIGVEKAARDRAASVRDTIQKRFGARIERSSIAPSKINEGSAE